MNQKRFSSKYLFLAAVIVLIVLIAGCAGPISVPRPEDTSEPEVVPVTGKKAETIVATSPPVPTPSVSTPPAPAPKADIEYSVVELADGSKIIVPADAKYEVISVPKAGVKDGEVHVRLLQGEILVIPNPENKNWISVEELTGYFTRINGCSMMVMADPGRKEFGMDCLGGECEVGNPAGDTIRVKSMEEWIYKNGMPQGPGVVNMSELEEAFGEFLPACVQLIPVTGQEAADTPQPITTLNAQATNACNAFRAQFPGTPCP